MKIKIKRKIHMTRFYLQESLNAEKIQLFEVSNKLDHDEHLVFTSTTAAFRYKQLIKH